MKNDDVQIDFNFCRNLDFQKNLDISYIDDFIGTFSFKSFFNSQIMRKHLKFIIIELFSCWYENENQFLAVSLSKRGYKAKSRYNPNMISSYCIDLIKELKQKRLIDFYPGFFDSNRGISRLTRIKASKILIEEFKRTNFDFYEILSLKNRESLYLLDKDLKPKEYSDTFQTHEIREVINKNNSILNKTFFEIPSLETPFITRGDGTRIIISQLRIRENIEFNLNWQRGGNFTGSWWHKLDLTTITKYANHMQINGSKTSYIDFSNILSIFLFKKFGTKNIELDPTFFVKRGSFISSLDQLNLIIIKGISSKNEKGFFRSFCNDKKKMGIHEKVSVKDFQKFLETIASSNQSIFKLFFSNLNVGWDIFISKIFYDLLKGIGNAGIPIIKIKDKIFFPSVFEKNIENSVRKSMTKILDMEKLDIVIIKCLSYATDQKKRSFFNNFVGKNLKYSNRFISNKKVFEKIMKKNNIILN